MAASSGQTRTWLRNGREAFPAMLAAIDAARHTVRLEKYIFAPDEVGLRFRDALVQAQRRGAHVRVLVDAVGSYSLPRNFWSALVEAGGQARFFNPLALNRFGIRNHRKLLVCDERVAFIGGFNVAAQYDGDGVTSGWSDLGLRVESPLAAELAASFDEMFALAEFRHKRFIRFRKTQAKRVVHHPDEQLLLSGPGRGVNPIRTALHRDLAAARDVRLVVAYFLPAWRLRRDLARVVRRGGRVRLLLAGRSDVAVSQLAARSLYHRLLRAGVEIAEYQPQVLHAKLFVVDHAVYLGSANLDPRSLAINYELMVRFQDETLAMEARLLLDEMARQSVEVEAEAWRKSRSFWSRFKERWAYFLLARIDPYVARWQWRALPD
jgi:cardiolipin synthase